MFSTLTGSRVFPTLVKVLPQYMSEFRCLCVEAEEWVEIVPKPYHYFQVYLLLALKILDMSIDTTLLAPLHRPS